MHKPPWEQTPEEFAAMQAQLAAIPPGRPLGRFVKGTSGNPNGRPVGKGKLALLLDKLMEVAPEIQERLLAHARANDMDAMTLLYNKAVPTPRPRAVEAAFNLDTDLSPTEQAAQIRSAVAQGLLTLDEGKSHLDFLMAQVGLVDLEAFLFERRRLMDPQAPKHMGGIVTDPSLLPGGNS